MKPALRNLWLLGLLMFSGFFCTIRDDNGEPGISSPDNVIDNNLNALLYVSSESTYVGLKDTIAILARVYSDSSETDSLIPLKNIRIQASSNFGKLIKDTLYSDENGRARFLFTDSISRKVEITIRANNTIQSLRLEVTDTPDKVQKLIEAIPQRSVLSAGGFDSTTVLVQVMNYNHNPLVGEKVQFVTTSGIIIGDGSNKENSGQSITDQNGTAIATLKSSSFNDIAYISAYLISNQSLSCETKVEFRGITLSLQTDQNNLIIGDTALITAKLTNSQENAIERADIFFTLQSKANSNLKILSADSITSENGIAMAKIKAIRNGIDLVQVKAAGTEALLQLNVSSLKLRLDLNKNSLQTQESDSTVLIATFSNGSGAALANRNVTVKKYFKTENNADTVAMVSGITNALGKCSFTLYALPYEGKMRLEVIAFDKTEGYASADTSILFFTTRIMTIRAQGSIPADGTSKCPIIVTIKNKNGNPLVGDKISFITTAGMITAESETDEDGKAVAYLTSDRRNIVATVTATLLSDQTKKQTTQVAFNGIMLLASINPPNISSDGKDTALVKILLSDAAGSSISGERINISKQNDATMIIAADSATSNIGEAKCKIAGKGKGQDTISIYAAGASTQIVLNYSSNILKIDTIPGQPCIADSLDSTLITITYLKGDNITPIANAQVDVSVTVGQLGTVFAMTLITASNGKASIYIRNPHFATTSTISALAKTPLEQTSASFNLYFHANNVARIDLSGTPEVIPVNGSRSKLVAVAYDAMGNRVKDARLSFNIVNGPSGGEYIDPPVAVTGDDGSATSWFISGKTPSTYKQVWITAGNYNSIKSDTVKFTIAGPPHYITVRTNILKGKNPNDGTFILPCAAIVTDINGNPVADGTEVTFSLKVSGFVTKRLYSEWVMDAGATFCRPIIDTFAVILPFEDFNDNFRLDPGEDRNGDGYSNRGEDINGDGRFILGPSFIDINGDGIRQYDPLLPIEELSPCTSSDGIGYADLNNNDRWDPIEPLNNPTYLSAYYRLVASGAFRSYPKFNSVQDSIDFKTIFTLDSLYEKQPGFINKYMPFDADANQNGIADPITAVSIKRTVTTKDGKALNEIIYGQSDAGRIEITLWAESQGVITTAPDILILKIVSNE
ncbi:MAG TPA: Ig-like domain-containing protein [Chitinispirillaceae bacterium]|nr:Ig-like domain-containing protein [Chitinispirillaceae bacterium]